MDITYLGHSSFRLKGKTATVVTDPYDERCGKFPKNIVADIVTVSHDHADHNQTDKVQGPMFKIQGPGEYEVRGVSIIGIPTWHDDSGGAERGANTVYVIEMDGLRLCHLGDLGHRLNDKQLEEIGSVDIVMVPVGGVYTIDAKIATEVVKQVDPWVIIPMHYQTGELKLSNPLRSVEEFIKEIGKTAQILPKYVVVRDQLPTETALIVLEKRS